MKVSKLFQFFPGSTLFLCAYLAGSSWKIGENISAWLYFSKLFMISYWCLTRIYYSRRTHEQDRLTSSSTELYVPLRTHINILFFLELYLNGICYTRTLLIPKPSTNLRVGSSHHPPHPRARPPPAWSWLPAFSWLRTASSSPPPPRFTYSTWRLYRVFLKTRQDINAEKASIWWRHRAKSFGED